MWLHGNLGQGTNPAGKPTPSFCKRKFSSSSLIQLPVQPHKHKCQHKGKYSNLGANCFVFESSFPLVHCSITKQTVLHRLALPTDSDPTGKKDR